MPLISMGCQCHLVRHTVVFCHTWEPEFVDTNYSPGIVWYPCTWGQSIQNCIIISLDAYINLLILGPVSPTRQNWAFMESFWKKRVNSFIAPPGSEDTLELFTLVLCSCLLLTFPLDDDTNNCNGEQDSYADRSDADGQNCYLGLLVCIEKFHRNAQQNLMSFLHDYLKNTDDY